MNGPKVTVILNNYNYAAFVEKSVESVLSQTYPHIEFVIVDDGSTDRSREILKQYETRAKIVLKENGGETSGRNEGFLHATGDIVAFLDADDYWKPEAVERVVQNWRPSYSKLQFHLQVVNHHGSPLGALMPRCRLDEGRVDHLLLTTGRYITCPTSGNFYSREFLARILPVPTDEWPQSMDSYAATFAGFYGEIGAIQEPLGYYRVHNENMTRIARAGIDLAQVERLMGRGRRLKTLIERIAGCLNLAVNPGIVTSHWLYLKLELAQRKLRSGGSFPELLSCAARMLSSALRSPELSPVKKIEMVGWTLGALFLPRLAAEPLLQIAFDLAPQGWLTRKLRHL
jgi:glycosyltransferase involved in cell wall biosynthesis